MAQLQPVRPASYLRIESGSCESSLLVLFCLYGGVDSTSPRDFMVSHRLKLLIAAAE